MTGANFKKTGQMYLIRSMGLICHPKASTWYILSAQKNLATLASAVPEIWLPVLKLKMGHVTLTTPLLGTVWIVIGKLVYDTVYLCIKFDESSLSRFIDIIGGSKI